MSSSDSFIYADNRAIIFHSSQFDGSAPIYRNISGSEFVKNDDVWVNLDSGSMRVYSSGTWQAVKIAGNTIDGAYPQEASLKIVDTNTNAAYQKPSLVFGGHTTDLFTVKAVNGSLDFFKLGSLVLRLNSSGNVEIPGNLTVTGDLFADDVGYDEALINILRVEDRIEHNGNATNRITFETDKVTIDASGTSIVLDDAAMTDKIVITGQTKFINNIDDVPDIYLQNHIHHSGDANTRIGFPANDQIALRTGGTDRLTITDTQTTSSNDIVVSSAGGIILNPGSNAGSASIGRSGVITNNVQGLSPYTSNIAGASGGGCQIEMNNTSIVCSTFPSTTNVGDAVTLTERMRLNATGLGIGTSTPAYPLHVNGSAKVTTIRDTANSAGTAGQLLSSTGTALQWLSFSLGSAVVKETQPAATNSAVQWPNPASNSLQKRQFNVVETNNLAVTVSGTPNWTFTIPTAGTYCFNAIAQFTVGDFVSNTTISTRLLLNNNTLGLGSVLLGDSSRIFTNTNVGFAFNSCNFSTTLRGIYTITGSTVFTLDQILTNAFAVCRGGFNANMLGYTEVYATLEITKLS
jgi:hypothetical protein